MCIRVRERRATGWKVSRLNTQGSRCFLASMTENPPSASSTPHPPPARKSLAQEFFDFLKTFGVIGLAIAFIIGAAASKLVTALVTDIVNPFVGLFLPAGDLGRLAYNATGVSGATSEFRYGDLIANIIDFLIIAFVVFLAYRMLSRYKLVEDKTKSGK